MKADPVLEALSDKVRSGEPIGFLEAIAVINYQEQLRAEREASRAHRRSRVWRAFIDGLGLKPLWRWIRSMT